MTLGAASNETALRAPALIPNRTCSCSGLVLAPLLTPARRQRRLSRSRFLLSRLICRQSHYPVASALGWPAKHLGPGSRESVASARLIENSHQATIFSFSLLLAIVLLKPGPEKTTRLRLRSKTKAAWLAETVRGIFINLGGAHKLEAERLRVDRDLLLPASIGLRVVSLSRSAADILDKNNNNRDADDD